MGKIRRNSAIEKAIDPPCKSDPANVFPEDALSQSGPPVLSVVDCSAYGTRKMRWCLHRALAIRQNRKERATCFGAGATIHGELVPARLPM